MNRVTKLLGSPTADWIVKVLVVIGTVVGVTIAIQQRELAADQRKEAACVARWADDYSRATSAQATAQQRRLNALHQLILDAVEKKGKASIDADVRTFVDTELSYQDALRNHPIPEPPELRCP